ACAPSVFQSAPPSRRCRRQRRRRGPTYLPSLPAPTEPTAPPEGRTMPTERTATPRSELVRLACAELERRLRAGEGCAAEEVLAAQPALAADPDGALELIGGVIRGKPTQRRRTRLPPSP